MPKINCKGEKMIGFILLTAAAWVGFIRLFVEAADRGVL